MGTVGTILAWIGAAAVALALLVLAWLALVARAYRRG